MSAVAGDRASNVGNRASRWPTLLRWSDQVCCVGLIVASLLWMAASWMYQGGLRGRIIDIEQAPYRPVTFQVDINRADFAEWSVLPGIGETLAKRIVSTRRTRGSFGSHEDLLEVRGIGERTLDRIRPYLLPIEGPRHGS